MAPRTSRIEVRTDRVRKQRIRYAAELANESLNAFVLHAAAERAEMIIDGASIPTVPPQFFDSVWAALDEPDRPNAALRARARKPRRFVPR